MIPTEIKLFYDSLENLKSLNIWNINKEISAIKSIDEAWKHCIVIEKKILSFNLNKGVLKPNFIGIDAKGKEIDEAIFDSAEISYIKERISQVKNAWLLARYAHLLWQETKDNRYGEIAIKYYLENLKIIKQEELQELSKIISATFWISKKTKLKVSEVKEAAMVFVNDFPNHIKFSIIELIIENNIFTKSELQIIAENSCAFIKEIDSTAYFLNKSYLNTTLRLFNKINKPAEDIYKLLALNEDIILNEHPNDEDFVKYTTIATKAAYLKLAKDMVGYEAAMKEYNRLKQTIKLKKISVELDDEKTELFNKYLNFKADEILKLSPDKILSYFAASEDILVDPVENKNNAQQSINNSLYALFSTSVFDINTNFRKLKDSDKLDYEIIKSYTIAYNIKFYSFFVKVAVQGILSGKINYYHIYDFLNQYTWYGMKFKRSATMNEIDENTSWITMLAPGIHNLFAQFEYLILLNNNKIGNFILAIDSLTLKFEGALRDFIRLTGGSTTIQKKGELQEQLLEELLDSSVVKQYFSEKDIELFKHTFTKKGKNIRNNVAHSFMEFSDYSLQTAVMVFFCLLRLGKYTFTDENNERNEL